MSTPTLSSIRNARPAAAAFDLDEIRTAFLAKRAEQKGRKPREIVTPAC